MHELRRPQPGCGTFVLSVLGGVIIALLYSGIATALWVIRGMRPWYDGEIGLLDLYRGYLVGGLAGGIVVGCLLPLARWKLGAAVVGAAAGIVAGSLLMYTVDGTWEPIPDAIAGSILGIIVGLAMWEEYQRTGF